MKVYIYDKGKALGTRLVKSLVYTESKLVKKKTRVKGRNTKKGNYHIGIAQKKASRYKATRKEASHKEPTHKKASLKEA